MTTQTSPYLGDTAADVMTTGVVTVPHDMPVRNALARLLRHQIGGAPVVDAHGRCIGAISYADVARLVLTRGGVPTGPRRPLSCGYQEHLVGPYGRELVRCVLADGACPYQRARAGDAGTLPECVQPYAVSADWQVVQLEGLPADGVLGHMTADPVTVVPDTPIGALARMMIDAYVHRVFVVDDEGRPVGVVSTIDILAVVAGADVPSGT